MIQFHTQSWKNRAVWGAPEKIGFGSPNTTEKVHMGQLPQTGQWVKLEVPARKIGLKPGTKVTGFAFTQFGGTVNWDRLGVTSSSDPANDPNWSWQVWKSQDTQKRNKLLPEHLRRQLQGRNPDQWSPEESETVFALWMRNVYLGARDLIDQLSREKGPLQAQVTAIEKSAPITFVMADLEKPRQSFVMLRGAYDQKGDRVTRQVPAFLPKLKKQPAGQDYNRLDLADWLVNGAHPLTARVTVNRFWQQFFGTGLVKTSEDFGSQGAAPTHPELLDWLAVQFVEDGWDMKRLVKRIVTSHAYRQNTRVHPDVRAIDPENLLLSRGPRLRLDAEVIRDQALFVSGLLVPRFGGPGVKPYQPPNIWEPVGFGNSNTRYYKQGTGDDLYRRSIYTFLKRTAPPPFMSSFDAPNREQSCSRRGRSNTPLQALQLMNDVQHVEAARCLAERMLKEGGATPEKRIHWCWQVVTSRQPNTDEIKIVRETLQRHLDRFTADTPAAAELIAFGESQADESTNPAELAAYTLIANLILNLDETVSKN